MEDNWDLVAPHLLDYNYTIPKEKHAQVARNIKKHYYGSKSIDRSNVKPLTLMVGDRLFVADAEKAARLQAESNERPVWFFYYSYRAAQSLSDTLSGTKENFGKFSTFYIKELYCMNITDLFPHISFCFSQLLGVTKKTLIKLFISSRCQSC